jgi:DNA-binding response OmpR family regulator
VSGSSTRPTVLVVEDDASLRHMIRWTLEANGYVTLVAHHGGEAIQAVREHGAEIDLLITGVIRSATGSSIAADAIRMERPGIRVLFVSKDVAGVTTPFGLERGPVFLGGPYAPYALLHRVRAVLRDS